MATASISRHLSLALATLCALSATAGDANRLVYLDESDPYYVSRTFPKLTTPMWVGEAGVEAVVLLSIDDMSDPAKYEAYLRPILNRLKQIDGRAPVTIFANKPDPADPVIQGLLDEGCCVDVHTMNHPCPLLNDKGFDWSSDNVHDCTALLNQIPNNTPVAFRMPCCDSQNTPSPRFYDGIFDKSTSAGQFLSIDSSIFNITTANDPDLPRELVVDPDGRERFRKYLPFPSFVNTIEDYPYPYIINRVCWEFPAMVPSDWEAQNINGKCNARSVEDMKAAIDVAVLKKGVYTLVFHPHGWIENNQVVDMIDHVVAKHGSKVKFMNFTEVQARLNANLLDGSPLRDARGRDNGVRMMDLNEDGYLDVIIGNGIEQRTRVWNNNAGTWIEQPLPFRLVDGEGQPAGMRFGPGLDARGGPVALLADGNASAAYAYNREGWAPLPDVAEITAARGVERTGSDAGVRLRDLDGDGKPELLISNPEQNGVFQWDGRWRKLPFTFPEGVRLVDETGADQGLRFVDLEPDGDEDLVFANESGSGVYLFDSIQTGWGDTILPADKPLPPITVDGANNGAWFHSRHLWVMNETTAKLPDLVDRRAFNEILSPVKPEARTPEASRASIVVEPGYQVELVASEPMVVDPIALAWGADGGLYVVEMRDYPNGLDGHGEPGSRIRLLRDDDGDGKYDRSTIYHDGLAFAMGLFPWRKGLLVTCAPNIYYLEDTDGDDVADVEEVLYSGFGEGNQQHRVNGLRWGLDNWIYGANGDSSGEITSLKSGDTLSLRGRDFRIRPDTGAIDGQAGQTQYGRARDDWGNWFGCNNSNPLYHYSLASEYARRNPHFAFNVTRHNTIDGRDNYAISRFMTRFNEDFNANKFTSVCGLEFYRDRLLGDAFYGNAFIAEPVHNLVFRMIVEPDGATFNAHRPAGEEKREFLASTDNWFRPVMARTGPDGALWIADMYRAQIEHPEYVSEVDQAKTNFLEGNDRGHIYRVYPVDKKPRPIIRLDNKSPVELAALLADPNSWVRDTAHQLLYERQDASAVPALEKLAADKGQPVAQIHAINVLDGMNALSDDLLAEALASREPGVLCHAIRLAEGRLDTVPALGPLALAQRSNPDKKVLVQLAYSLGAWDSPEAAAALGRLMVEQAGDPFVSYAAITALNPKNTSMILDDLIAFMQSPAVGEDRALQVLGMTVRMAEAGNSTEMVARLAKAMATPADGPPEERHYAAAATLLESARGPAALDTLLGDGAASEGELAPLMAVARQAAADPAQPESLRVRALDLLGRQPAHRESDRALAKALVDPREPLGVARAAVDTLVRGGGAGALDALLAGWPAYTQELRGQVLEVLLAQPAGVDAVLAHMEAGKVSPRQLDAGHRQTLLTSPNPAVRERVETLMADLVNPDRVAVIAKYTGAADLTGDRARGQKIYEERCSKCHQVGTVGYAVGPDLAAAGSGSFETLIAAILDPNQAVEGRYTPYTVETANLETYTGVLADENANSITLANAGGVQQTVLRSDITAIAAADTSIMPEGLEEGLEPADLADLIAFIRGRVQTPKSFPGNEPAPVAADPDGTLALLATNAAIFGDTLVYEPTYRNLGYWGSANDHAVWNVNVPAAGTYDVVMEYCCDASTAGNLYRLESGANILSGRVKGTGTWDRYREETIGRLAFDAGEQRVVFRAEGPINQYLIDLRAIRLKPVK